MATEWVENRAGIDEFLESDPEVIAMMEELAHRAAEYAQSIAPVGSPLEDDRHVGAYRESIGVERRTEGPGYRVLAHDQKAHWIEYGAAHTPRLQVLTRAVETIRGDAIEMKTGG